MYNQNLTIKTWAEEDRPREKLSLKGKNALSDAELIAILIGGFQCVNGQSAAAIIEKESEFYKIVDVPIPDDVKLEVGGLSLTDDGELGVSTRRGEVWLLDNPNSSNPIYSRYAHGLLESLGLAYKDNGFYKLSKVNEKWLCDVCIG